MSCRTTCKPGSKCFFLSWTTPWSLRYGRERAVWQDQTHWECESHSWKHTGPLRPIQACSSIHPFHFMMNATTSTQHYGLVDRRIPLSVLWPVDEGSVEGLELFLKRRSSYWLKRTRTSASPGGLCRDWPMRTCRDQVPSSNLTQKLTAPTSLRCLHCSLNQRASLLLLWAYLGPGPNSSVGGGIFPHHQASLWTSAGYPTVWLNSDTINLEIVSDSTGEVP